MVVYMYSIQDRPLVLPRLLLPLRRKLLQRRRRQRGLLTPRLSTGLAPRLPSRLAHAGSRLGRRHEVRVRHARCRHSRVGMLAPWSLSRQRHADARHAGSRGTCVPRQLSFRQALASGWRGGWLDVVLQLPSSLGRADAGVWRGGRLGWLGGRVLPCGCRLSCAASMRGGRRHMLVLLLLLLMLGRSASYGSVLERK